MRLIPQINRPFTDFRRFPRSISVKPTVVVMSQRRDVTRNLAIATTMRKSFATNLCFLEVRTMPYRHRVGTHKIRKYPPIATIHVDFFFCGNMGVVFVRQFVHLANHFFSATQFEHGFSEPCITDKSIVNVLVLFLSTLLLELICSVEFFATFFLPVPVTVWSALPDLKVRDGEEIKNGLDVLLVVCCVISQEVSARAVDDANVPIRQACSAL